MEDSVYLYKDTFIFCLFSWKAQFFFLCVFHRRSSCGFAITNHHITFMFVWTIPLNVVRNITGADKNVLSQNREGSEKTQGCSLLASINGHSLKMSCTVTNGSSSDRASIVILTILTLM